jgi:hypothetical protein
MGAVIGRMGAVIGRMGADCVTIAICKMADAYWRPCSSAPYELTVAALFIPACTILAAFVV